MRNKQILFGVAGFVVVVAILLFASSINAKTAPRLPDLIINGMYANTSVGNYTNGTYNIFLSAIVLNKGQEWANTSFTLLGVYGHGNRTVYTQPPLGPSQSTQVGAWFYLPAGNYSAFGYADIYNQVAEKNENNNAYNFMFRVP